MIQLESKLKNHQKKNLFRQRLIFENGCKILLKEKNSSFLNFCSNDYLGLASHPTIIKAFKSGVDQYGVGSGASYLISGYRKITQEMEQRFAEFLGFPKALFFANGYMANLGVISSLANLNDAVYQDRYNHASLLDAGKLSRATSRRYLHRDCQSLEKYLVKNTKSANKFIVTDGVFSMTGEIAPLADLNQLSQNYHCFLVVDDAHGVGFLGKTGKGSLELLSINFFDRLIGVFPLGKAFGCYGALVAASEEVIESLIQFARPYIYTTAPPPAIACASLASLQIIEKEAWRREKLQKMICFFRKKAEERGLFLNPSATAIQTITINDNVAAIHIAKKMKQSGFLIGMLRPPTVPTALLRITLRVDHEENDIMNLLDNLQEFSLYKKRVY